MLQMIESWDQTQLASIVTEWDSNGFVGPIRVIDENNAKNLEDIYLDYQKSCMTHFGREVFIKPHLLNTNLAAIATEPVLLDAVEALIGSDILLWSSSFFIKTAHSGKKVGLHQDSHDWGLRPSTDIVSVWIAFTPSIRLSGAVAFCPGTHKLGMIDHRHTYSPDNMLSLGQEVEHDVNEADMTVVELQPGEMSMHHGDVIHGGNPNDADWDRIGLILNYIKADTVQSKGDDSVTVVRGDYNGPFVQEKLPQKNFSPEAIAEFKKSLSFPSGFNDMTLR